MTFVMVWLSEPMLELLAVAAQGHTRGIVVNYRIPQAGHVGFLSSKKTDL